MMMVSDCPDLVRRRGRWINAKVAEIYIQEVSALQLLPQLPKGSRQLIFAALEHFATLWKQVIFLQEARIPASVWHHLLAAGKLA